MVHTNELFHIVNQYVVIKFLSIKDSLNITLFCLLICVASPPQRLSAIQAVEAKYHLRIVCHSIRSMKLLKQMYYAHHYPFFFHLFSCRT